uniref:Uncharacterized protein n=1 Tax=Anguilla anguilla TaxID=7936 RepID=A0A0E9WZM7_ANGAN
MGFEYGTLIPCGMHSYISHNPKDSKSSINRHYMCLIKSNYQH